MKTKILVCCFLVLGLLAGCYEEGPPISLRTKIGRMTFVRPITFYNVNGVDSLAGLQHWFQDSLRVYSGKFEFEYLFGDQQNHITNGLSRYDVVGVWEFERSFRGLYMRLEIGYHRPFNASWDILRLSNRQLWLRQDRNGDVLELRFEE